MKRDIIYLLAIGILIWMLANTCNGSDKKTNADLKASRDSAAMFKRAADSNYDAYAKVTIDLKDYQVWANDSIAKLNEITNGLYQQNDFASLRVKNLISTAREAAIKAKDTAMLARIDQAEQLAAERDGIVQYLKSTGKKRDSIYTAEITTCNLAQDKKDSLYLDLHNRFNGLSLIADHVQGEAETLAKSNAKRFSVGPYIGYGITGTGKLQPSIGISLSYQLFKF
jgi:hypothetical protein